MALTYLVINIPVISRLLQRSTDNPLTVLGRHSLSIFVAGTILAMVGQVVLYINNHDQIVGPVFVVIGIAIQFAYAYHLERKRLDEKAKPAIGRGAMLVPGGSTTGESNGAPKIPRYQAGGARRPPAYFMCCRMLTNLPAGSRT